MRTAGTFGIAADPSDVKTIVNDLDAGWYNEVTKQLGIKDPNFQLAQGTLGLQTADSSGLFLMADSVPENAAVAYYDPSGLSKRSSAYSMLLRALLPESGTDLAAFLGDMYPAWITFRDNFFQANPTSTLTQAQVFATFANQKLDPGKAQQAISAYQSGSSAPLNQARDAMSDAGSKQTFLDSQQHSYALYKYVPTNAAAVAAINTGSSVNINFDSNSMETSLSHNFAEASAGGGWWIFSAKASGSFDQLNTKAAQQRFTITGKINKAATVAVNPVNWFNTGEFLRAYNAPNDNTIWDPQANAGGWDSFFGTDGSLRCRVDQLVLVSDYTITVTSYAKYSQDDYQQIKAAASFSVWPFFSASSSATHTTEYTLNNDANLVATHTLNKGLIQIWGAIVKNAPK